MDENRSEFGAFLAGFVIGGLVGAAAALILAPQSGSETRSQIVGKSQDFREAGSRRANQARESASTYVHDFSDLASEKSHQVQEQARIVLDAGRSSAENIDGNATLEVEDFSGTETESPTVE
jgi:gas vesicle protein